MIRRWLANLIQRKAKIETLVDLGGGRAFRTRALAGKHPKKSFSSIDKHLKPFIFSRNFKAIRQDAIEYLQKRKAESIKILNMDFAGGSKKMVAKYKIDESEGIIIIPEFLKDCKRVLTPNGRLYLTIIGDDLQEVLRLLHAEGFKTSHQSLKKLHAKERLWSSSEQIDAEFSKHHSKHRAWDLIRETQTPKYDFLANTVRIEARKAGFAKARN